MRGLLLLVRNEGGAQVLFAAKGEHEDFLRGFARDIVVPSFHSDGKFLGACSSSIQRPFVLRSTTKSFARRRARRSASASPTNSSTARRRLPPAAAPQERSAAAFFALSAADAFFPSALPPVAEADASPSSPGASSRPCESATAAAPSGRARNSSSKTLNQRGALAVRTLASSVERSSRPASERNANAAFKTSPSACRKRTG